MNILKNAIQNKFYFYFVLFLETIQIIHSILLLFIPNRDERYYRQFNLHGNCTGLSISSDYNNNTSEKNNEIFMTDFLQFLSLSSVLKNALINCIVYETKVSAHSSITQKHILYFYDALTSIIFNIIVIYFCFISIIYAIIARYNTILSSRISEVDNKRSHRRNIVLNYFYMKKLAKVIIANIPEIVFHIFGSFILDLNINRAIVKCKKIFSLQLIEISDIYILGLGIIYLIIYVALYIWYVENINLIINFSNRIKSPHDSFLSVKYNYVLLLGKIIISLESNLSLIKINNYRLLGFLKISIAMNFLVFTIKKLFFLWQKRVVYLSHRELNLFRVFNISIINTLMISEFYFSLEYKLNSSTIILALFCLICSLCIASVFDNLNFKNLINSNEVSLQLAYIINIKYEYFADFALEKASERQHGHLRKIKTLISQHFQLCKKSSKDCFINKIKDLNNFNEILIGYEKAIKADLLKEKSKEVGELELICILVTANMTKDNNLNQKVITAFFNLHKFNNKKFNYESIFKELIIKEIRKKINANKENQTNKPLGNKQSAGANFKRKKFLDFELVNVYSNIFPDFTKCCDLIFLTVDSLYYMGYDMVFKNAFTIDGIKTSIKKQYSIISKYRREYQDLYSLFFIKFIYKKLFNQKLYIQNERSFPAQVEFKTQILTHYLNDKFINIFYDGSSLKIFKTSKDFIDYIDKDFVALFPDFCKEICRNNFLEFIEKTGILDFNKEFLFQLSNKTKDFNLKIVNAECKIYPSFCLSKLLITLKCDFLNAEVIVFEENLKFCSEFLTASSIKISADLCLKNYFLSFSPGINLEFMEVFSSDNKENRNKNKANKSILPSPNVNISISADFEQPLVYYINYESYSKKLFQLAKKLKERDIISEEEYADIENQYELNKLKNNLYEVEMFDYLKTEAFNYKIFKIKIHENNKWKNNKNNVSNSNNTDKVSKADVFNSNKNRDSVKNKQNILEFQISENSISLSVTSQKEQNKFKQNSRNNASYINVLGFNKNVKYNWNTYQSRIKFFIKLLLSIIIFLFIVGIVVSFIAIDKINDIKNLFKLNFYYNKLINNYYGAMINLYQNIVIYGKDSQTTDDVIDLYYELYSAYGINISLPEYVAIESLIKIEQIRELVAQVKNLFFLIDYKEIAKDFFQKKMDSYYVINSNNNISVKKKEIFLFESLDLLTSSGKIVASNPDIITYIYILDTSKNEFNFDNYFNKTLSVFQLNAINLILNFEPQVKNMEYYRKMLSDLFYSELNMMKLIFNNLNLLLLLFHLLLIFLVFIIVKYFKRILHANICALEFMLEGDKVLFIKSKLLSLKKLSTLYNSNPSDIINDLKIQKKKSKEILSTNNKKLNLSYHNPSVEIKTREYNMNIMDYKYNKTPENNTKWSSGNQKRLSAENIYNNCYIKERLNNNNNYKILQEAFYIASFNSDKKNQSIKYNFSLLIMIKSSLFVQFCYFKLFFIMFYIVYSFLIFTTFENIHQQNISQNELAEIFWLNGQRIIKNGVLINSIFLLNRTEDLLSVSLSPNNATKYSFKEDVKNFYSELNLMKKKLKDNPQYSSMKSYFFDYIYCDLMYSDFYSDSFLAQIAEFYTINKQKNETYLRHNLKSICSYFMFSQEKNIFMIFEYLNKLINSLLNRFLYNEKSYEKLLQLFYSYEFGDLNLIMIVILRPVRYFIEKSLINDIIVNVIDEYVGFIALNLILNFLVEFLFFCFVKIFIINKTNNIDKNMKNLMDSLLI